METPQSFIEHYRAVFETFDAAAIAEQFAFPVQVTGDVGAGVTIGVAAGKEQWLPQLEALLAGYRRIGVVRSEVRALDVVAISEQLAFAHVRWALFAAGDRPLYEFRSTYTLGRVDGRLRVVAIAHDEGPRLRAAIAAASTPS